MPSDDTTTLADLRNTMRRWVAERDWQQYHLPKNLAASVCIEAGELLEHFQWLTPEEVAQRQADPAFKQVVGEELCDVLMYLVSLANAMDIDIAAAVAAKMEKNARKYPVGKFDGERWKQELKERVVGVDDPPPSPSGRGQG